MTAFPTTHTRMTRLARQVRPRAHAAGKAAI